ncbi:MAG: DUF429 domain-containing protein [Terriglobales bacterium]
MITTRIDLASQAEHTAECSIHWIDGRADVRTWKCGVTDDGIISTLAGSDKVGIDVPLGWPNAFVRAIYRHHAKRSWRPARLANLRYRATDRFIVEKTRRWPLSVSTDLISVPALRAAAIVANFEGFDLDRSGSAKIVEVYPAAALRVWGFVASRYKGANRAAARIALVDSLRAETNSWLLGSDHCFDVAISDDNILDAFIAALVARAAVLNLVHPIPRRLRRAARTEGWIALPLPGSLASPSNAPAAE